MQQGTDSFFHDLFSDGSFVDRFITQPEGAVDVLIPVVHTNELWRANLLSAYREIPVNRLLIGDGGCIDNSIEIARQFPRVVVFDHSHYVSLGYSLRQLIEAVETEWFIYLHSDVYLPEGWFEAMRSHQAQYDWFECRQQLTLLIDIPHPYRNFNRPLSGSQMGRKAAFQSVLPVIGDDYLYRNEDIILAELVKQAGFRYGRADDVFHHHEVMHKPSPWLRKVKSVSIQTELSREEEIRACMMQVKGIIKYLQPRPDMPLGLYGYPQSLSRLLELGALDWAEFKRWVAETNPAWLPYIRKGLFKQRLIMFLRAAYELFLAR